MVCTTFLHDSELNQQLPEAEIQYLLDAVRTKSGNDWQVVRLEQRKAGLFGRKRPQLYGVYVYVGGIGPWQQINFFKVGAKSSINLYVPLETVAAYLYGMHSGLWEKATASKLK